MPKIKKILLSFYPSLFLAVFVLFLAVPVKAAVIEKISAPDQIKYFKITSRIDNTLYGYRLKPQSDSTPLVSFVVSSSSKIMVDGLASWYKYKNGLFAASPDYAKGTVLRVYNLANGKFVDVTVNDYGPDRIKHQSRAIDLDYVAFKKIAATRDGIIQVKVVPLKNIKTQKTVVPLNTSVSLPVSASSAIVISEKTGAVLYAKDANQVLPIASLSKLVFAKVFLDLKPNLERVVTYKYQDEAYNYEYCDASESARLRVKAGDTMTVQDLLYSALVGSANNAVESLVRVSGLSRLEFIASMNKFAKKLGAKDTNFVEPTGLSPENVSSAADYAIMTKAALSDKTLKKISSTANYSFTTIKNKEKHNLKNTNQLLKTSAYTITGSKTGYLDEAGYCLMTEVTSPQGNLIAINLNSKSKAENFSDNEQLIKYGLKILKK
jgi:D-alanyl-D-alanine endopeptidase (penicillin-binding protein 7)